MFIADGLGIQMVQAAVVDRVFHAQSNTTRRAVLEKLRAGPATVRELAAPFDDHMVPAPGTAVSRHFIEVTKGLAGSVYG